MASQDASRENHRDEIVDAFAHDLRIPVANILGFVDLLREGSGDSFTEEQLDFLGRIEANCQTLLNMYDRLLAQARPLDAL